MRATLRSTFAAEAKAIDPAWELPAHGKAAMAKWTEALTKRARKVKRNKYKSFGGRVGKDSADSE